MRSITVPLCLFLGSLWITFAFAADNSCWLKAPPEASVWVIVYNADADGNRDNVLWRGEIQAGQKVMIESKTGYIRYDYTLDPNQPYGGDIPIGCFNQRSEFVD